MAKRSSRRPSLKTTAGEQQKRRGRPFGRGQSGNPAGRPRGVPNKVTREIKDAARQLLEDPVYLQHLQERLRKGNAPHMETLLHHYAYGKPTDRLEVKDVTDVDGMTYDEMVAELRALAEKA